MEEHKMTQLTKFKTLLKSISILSVICFFFFASCTDDPPTCEITAPADEAVVLQGSSVTIEVDADDDDGTLFRKPSIEKVNFLIDDILVETVTSAPYSYIWSTIGESLGYHDITTVAIDNGDNSTQAEISILVNDAPTCDITDPSNNFETFQGSVVDIEVDADDDIGGVVSVKFYVDNSLEGTDGTSPYSYSWNTENESIGNHTVKAVAVDSHDEETDDAITVEIKECLLCGTWEGSYSGYDSDIGEDIDIKRELTINKNTTYYDILYGKQSDESEYITYEWQEGNWIISDDEESIVYTATDGERIDIKDESGTLESYDFGTHEEQISLNEDKDRWFVQDENLGETYELSKQD
jgi:hypothetical protein